MIRGLRRSGRLSGLPRPHSVGDEKYWTTRDDTSSVPLPPVSMPGSMLDRHATWLCARHTQGVRGAGCHGMFSRKAALTREHTEHTPLRIAPLGVDSKLMGRIVLTAGPCGDAVP